MRFEIKSQFEINQPAAGAPAATGTAGRLTKLLGGTALTVAFGLAFTAAPLVTALPAFAQTAPPKVVTSTPALTAIGAGGCIQQYSGEFSSLAQSALDADLVGLTANAVGAAADVVGLGIAVASATASAASFGVMAGGLVTASAIVSVPVGLPIAAGAATALSVTSGVDIAGFIAQGVGAAASVTGVASGIVGQGFNQTSKNLNDYVAGLPDCEKTFTGTVTVAAGGVNVTGDSIFFGDVGFVGGVEVGGSLDVAELHAALGISAYGGSIVLGKLDGTGFFEGITIGGGAIAGAGIGGAEAFTGDVTAIAIGNGASASSINSTALGTGAEATGIGGTALGANASALGNGATAIGGDADASGVGAQADTAGGTSAIAIGDNSSATTTTGDASIAIGLGASSTGSVSLGTGASSANGGTAIGDGSSATFANSTALGAGAAATRADQVVVGTESNTYTLPGIALAASTAEQSGPLGLVTSDPFGNLASDTGLYDQIGRNKRNIAHNEEGIALALAMEAPYVPLSQSSAISVGYGNFRGSSSFAFSGAFRVDPNVQFNAGLGVGLNRGSIGARVGVTIGW